MVHLGSQYNVFKSGADPGFQVRGGGGAHLKKLRQAEEGAKFFGVFRVKNHDFTPKNHIVSNFRGSRAGCTPPPPPLNPLLQVEQHVYLWTVVSVSLQLV